MTFSSFVPLSGYGFFSTLVKSHIFFSSVVADGVEPFWPLFFLWNFRLVRYGCTETGGLASNGSIPAGAELRLRDLPEMGYLTSDRPFPRGEILAKVAASGYFSLKRWNADGTLSEDLDSKEWLVMNGVRYFCTGDVGERRGPDEIRIIDRCKNHFKLAQGIFVAPESCYIRRSILLHFFSSFHCYVLGARN